MIDLRNESLPTTITVDGRDYLIETDFRKWIEFERLYFSGVRPISEFFYLFKKEIPRTDFSGQLLEFFINENSTPKSSGKHSDEKIFDFVEDGEFIVASFMKDYGIDLTDKNCKMHWHLFKALFEGLSSDTKMNEIIGFRSYKKSNKKMEQIYAERKEAWKLPVVNKQSEIMEEINKEFYGC